MRDPLRRLRRPHRRMFLQEHQQQKQQGLQRTNHNRQKRWLTISPTGGFASIFIGFLITSFIFNLFAAARISSIGNTTMDVFPFSFAFNIYGRQQQHKQVNNNNYNGEMFEPESALWNRMAKGWDYRHDDFSNCTLIKYPLHQPPQQSSSPSLTTTMRTGQKEQHLKRKYDLYQDSFNRTGSKLEMLGFRHDVIHFLRQQCYEQRRDERQQDDRKSESNGIVIPSTFSFLRGGGFQQSSNLIPSSSSSSSSSSTHTTATCVIPSSTTSCHVNRYSTIVLSNGKNLRRLVTNIMSFQSYQASGNVVVILHHGMAAKRLKDDIPYGQRLWDWHVDGIVTLIVSPSSSIWHSLELLSKQTMEDAVLWINGDHKKDWNGTMLLRTVQSWRENSKSIVTMPSQSLERSNLWSHSLWCGHVRRQTQEQKQSWRGKGISLLPEVLHGIVIHRSYLCYLNNHPVFSKLRNYTDALFSKEDTGLSGKSSNSMWEINRLIIALILQQVTLEDDKLLSLQMQNASSILSDSPHSEMTISGSSRHVAETVDTWTRRHETTLVKAMNTLADYFGVCYPFNKIQKEIFSSKSAVVQGDHKSGSKTLCV